MKEYKINCVGMSDKQKRLVQDAFFKIGYKYTYDISTYHYGEYYFTNIYGYVTYMAVEDVKYFEDKSYTELTFNELMKLANMEEHMTFTKADLKDGMFVRLTNGNIYIKVSNHLLCATGYMDLRLYDDNLNRPDNNWSVSEVLELRQDSSYVSYGMEDSKHFDYITIWKRPEPISAQQKAILDLEAKQQELIDQAEKIKADIAKLKGM